MGIDDNSKPTTFPHQCAEQSRIPIPVAKISKLPVRNASKIPRSTSSKNGPRASLIERLPNLKTQIIKPVIKKRASPPFKEFNLVKAGSKPVVKKKYATMQKQKLKKVSRQTTLPENFFIIDNTEIETLEVSAKEATEKENAPPDTSEIKGTEVVSELNTPLKDNKISIVEMQKQLNIEFEASEFYRNQILSNTELTPKQLLPSSNPFKFDQKKYSGISTLEKMKKLSISKPNPFSRTEKHNQSKSSVSGLCKSVQKVKCNEEGLQLRSTWCPGASNWSPCKPDPYEVAMASIKRLSFRKTSCPIEMKFKDSPPPSTQQFDAYQEAMRRIEALNRSRSSQKTLIMPEFNGPIKEATFIVQSPKLVSPCLKSLSNSETRSIYRPLKSLKASLTSQGQRLTDISEHSETDVANSLTNSFTDAKRKSGDPSCDHPATVIKSDERFSQLRPSELSHTHSSISEFSSQKLDLTSINCFSYTPRVELKTAKNHSPLHLHTPRPVSFYSRKTDLNHMHLFDQHSTKSTSSHPAPICTPLVLQTIARKNEEENILSPIKMKLDFDATEKPKDVVPKNSGEKVTWETRFSFYTKHIPTRAKMDDICADEECSAIMSLQPSPSSLSRTLYNPVAKVLSEGDQMHFMPIPSDIVAH